MVTTRPIGELTFSLSQTRPPQEVPRPGLVLCQVDVPSPLAIVWGVGTCSFDRAAGFYDATRGLPDDVRDAVGGHSGP